MDYNENEPNQEKTLENPTPDATASTARRTVTAVLVLIAALLLGYVLYTILLQNENGVQIPSSPTDVVEEEATPDERKTALDEINQMEKMEFETVDTEEISQQERAANLEKIDTSDSSADTEEVSRESRAQAISQLN